MLTILFACAVLAIAAVACVTDVREHRIPNVLTFGGAAVAVVCHGLFQGWAGVLSSAEGWAVGALLFLPPFALRGLGGGDVKLLAAIGAWLGPQDTLWLAAYTAIAGGVIAVGVALAHSYLRQALQNVWLLLAHWTVTGIRPLGEISLEGSAGPRLTYAIPIFLGTVITLWLH